MQEPTIRGMIGTVGVRFAPSPTGTFHLGNLRTAWVSHFLARELKQPWVLRFEDIDVPRVVPGAMERQLEDMRTLGMHADEVLIQSRNRERHWTLFNRARAEGAIYPCSCSRKDITRDLARELDGVASAPHRAPPLYSGRCRHSKPSCDEEVRHETLAWRFKADDPSGAKDFIIARSGPLNRLCQVTEESFVPGYNWACAIDDLDGRYALVVRCVDLRPVAEQQQAIQRWVDSTVPRPAVFHTALVLGVDGNRLEKRTKGVTLPELKEVGWTSHRIVGCFRRSFTGVVPRLQEIDAGMLLAEERERINQNELLMELS